MKVWTAWCRSLPLFHPNAQTNDLAVNSEVMTAYENVLFRQVTQFITSIITRNPKQNEAKRCKLLGPKSSPETGAEDQDPNGISGIEPQPSGPQTIVRNDYCLQSGTESKKTASLPGQCSRCYNCYDNELSGRKTRNFCYGYWYQGPPMYTILSQFNSVNTVIIHYPYTI
jgi:hypothetical protein